MKGNEIGTVDENVVRKDVRMTDSMLVKANLNGRVDR